MNIKVLLADDHKIVIEGIKAVLNDHEDIEVVYTASNGEDVLNYLSKANVHIAVLDINMPVMDGLTCARQIKNTHPHVKVIILTMYAQKNFIEEIIKIGIDGCLLKNNTGKELKDAILRVKSGKSYYDLIQEFKEDEEKIKQFKLSEREIEIIKLLAEGLTSQEISERLYISNSTVKTHRKNILKKTGLHNTSQLIQFALNNNII